VSTIGLRDELAAFAVECERKLRKNDHKGHWESCTVSYLLRRLGEEKAELVHAIKEKRSRAVVMAEAADVANFAMMVADIYDPKEDSSEEISDCECGRPL